RGLSPEDVLAPREGFARRVARRAAETGEAVVTADALLEGGPKRPGVLGAGLRSVLAAPVRSPDGRRGSLYLDHRFQIGVFGARELKLTEAVADQCALACGRLALERAVEVSRGVERGDAQRELLRREAKGVARPTVEPARFYGLVGRSGPLRRTIARLAEASRHDDPILIFGPHGVGKETAARALHQASSRTARKLV